MKVFDHSLNEDDVGNYYMEREWRTLNNVHFSLQDVKRIIMPKHMRRDSDRGFRGISDK